MIGAFVKWSDDNRPRSLFAGYIIDGNGCHIWVGARDRHGYGQV